MTPEILLTLTILVIAVVLFMTERLRIDLVALLVLGALALTGLVTPEQALSGFSNPAVVTVWAVFVLSGGLSRTGVANLVGRQISRLAGQGEVGLLVVIMATSGVLSAFMNNIGVAAMLLPVVMDLARRRRIPPSRLLIPLAYGSLLGGMMTLIGTPPNILASDALRDRGLIPFQLFDFAPVGLVLTVVGIAFMALVGRRLLPVRDMGRDLRFSEGGDLDSIYGLQERLYVVTVPPNSILEGRTLGESRLGSTLGLNVVGIIENGRTRLAPDPGAVLQAGAQLLVTGRLDRLDELRSRETLIVDEGDLALDQLVSEQIGIAEISLSPSSALLGRSLREIDFRRKYGLVVLAVWREGSAQHMKIDEILLQEDDLLLVQGPHDQVLKLQELPEFRAAESAESHVYQLRDRLMVVRLPADSVLEGKTLAESRLAESFGLTLLGIVRAGQTHLMPGPEERLQADDTLLVKGQLEDLLTVRGLRELLVESQGERTLQELESERIGLMEAALSPRTTLAGKTLRQLHFRDKYGLSVLAIYREGRAFRSNLSDMPLRFGDALLLFGQREKMRVLASEPDFLLLAQEVLEPPLLHKSPFAALIMAAVVASVLVGWLPIAVAAVAGATLMVLTGCLDMEEAYRSIDWRAVFLIAGMLPLGVAMETSGAASYLAEGVVGSIGALGPLALIAGLFVMTTIASQFMPNAVVTVLMAPIAITTAQNLALSPYALLMSVAIAASASFLSPVGHAANVLVMGPGGYRFTDYIRVGFPLTLLMLAVVLLILPLFWPLSL